MGSIWLTDVEMLLRAHNPPGPIRTIDGWQTRSNSGGGYDSLEGIIVHHDASTGATDPDGSRSARHQTFVDAEKPNAAFHVAHDGTIWIMAAGGTNTQGAGGGMFGLPVDSVPPFVGNRRVIGIEQGNNGVGEPYPPAQQNSTLWLCAILSIVYGPVHGPGYNLAPSRVGAHFEWTRDSGRKIDPSGPSRWAPTGGRWNMAQFRADVQQEAEMATQNALDAAAAVWGDTTATPTPATIAAARIKALQDTVKAIPIPTPWVTSGPATQPLYNVLRIIMQNVGVLFYGDDQFLSAGLPPGMPEWPQRVTETLADLKTAVANLPGGGGTGGVDVDAIIEALVQALNDTINRTDLVSIPGRLEVAPT